MKTRYLIACIAALTGVAALAGEPRQYLRFDGTLTEDRLGVAVGRLGDVNGDGYADILVGARYADIGVLTDAGSVSVFSGLDGTELFRLNGEAAGDWFGVAVAGIGDVNGDGRPDFIVGAQFAKRDDGQATGAAYVYSGATGARLYRLFGDQSDGRFGVSVDGGKDIDGDGVPDFIVGAYTEDAAYIYSGATGNRIVKLSGSPASWYGFAVALLPDVNDDGRAEIMVAAPRAGAGKVTVYSGATRAELYSLSGEQSGDWFGFAIAAAGDLNGDGKNEILVGAREASPSGRTNAGSVYVYEGRNGGLLRRLDGANARDAFGTSVAAAGDVNRDGINDFLVGARFALNDSGQSTGVAYVFSGLDKSQNINQIIKMSGEAPEDWFGGSVAGVGDSNGDGWPEWVVGSAGADPDGKSNAGRAYVYGLKHQDVAVSAANAPRSARIGEQISISYSLVNHGESASVTTSLSVNGVRKTSSTGALDFMASRNSNFAYTLRAEDFSAGRSTLCVSVATDDYPADNARCVQVSQTL